MPRFRVTFDCSWDFADFFLGTRWQGGAPSRVTYAFANYVLDAERRELRHAGRVVALEPQIFDLLQFLICNRERVVSRDDLIAAVWKGRIVSESTLSSRINAVRSAIGDNGREQRLIKTLSKKGIRFVGAVQKNAEGVAVLEEANAAAALPDKTSIAVLPFTNLNIDPSQDYFSDGIVEDIITELSRFSELLVIARNSSFQYKNKSVDVRQVGRELGVRYVLQGSIRRASDWVRVSTQLIDATTGAHRWAERYDRKLRDVFSVQDEVARTIVIVIVAHVTKAETSRTLLKPAATWQAYDYYLRAVETLNAFWASYKAEDLYATRCLLEQSLSSDGNYARPLALLADTHLIAYRLPLDDDYLNPAALDRAYRRAYDALQLDANLPLAHAMVGLVLGFKRQYDASVAELERALLLNPNYTDWRFAMALVIAGEYARAIDAAQAHMRADPFYPPRTALWLGVAYFMLKRYPDALPHLLEAVSRAPNTLGCHLWSAANFAQLKRLQEARGEICKVLQIDPEF